MLQISNVPLNQPFVIVDKKTLMKNDQQLQSWILPLKFYLSNLNFLRLHVHLLSDDC